MALSFLHQNRVNTFALQSLGQELLLDDVADCPISEGLPTLAPRYLILPVSSASSVAISKPSVRWTVSRARPVTRISESRTCESRPAAGTLVTR